MGDTTLVPLDDIPYVVVMEFYLRGTAPDGYLRGAYYMFSGDGTTIEKFDELLTCIEFPPRWLFFLERTW